MCKRALYVMSRPLKSPRRNGPIGQLSPFSTAVSMSSKRATPASSRRYASCGGGREPVELGEYLALHAEILEDRFDDKVGAVHRLGQIGGRVHTRSGRLSVSSGQAPLLHAAVQVSPVGLHRLSELFICLVVE